MSTMFTGSSRSLYSKGEVLSRGYGWCKRVTGLVIPTGRGAGNVSTIRIQVQWSRVTNYKALLWISKLSSNSELENIFHLKKIKKNFFYF